MRDADDQEAIVLVGSRRKTVPDLICREIGIDQPGRAQVVPPSTATLDCFVKVVVVLAGFVEVVIDRVDHCFSP